MKRLEFDCSCDLAEKIETLLEEIDDDYTLISVYGKYNVIRELLEVLIADGFSIANEIQLEDCDVSNYDKEFVLYAKPDGVNVEKTFVDDRYLYGGGDISFVHEGCSSSLLKYIECDKIFEFGYSDEEENDECDKCDCAVKGNDNKSVPDAAKESFTINGKPVDRETYEKEFSKFADRYTDNIKDMLLRYADFMDHWNDLLRLFY